MREVEAEDGAEAAVDRVVSVDEVADADIRIDFLRKRSSFFYLNKKKLVQIENFRVSSIGDWTWTRETFLDSIR